MYRDQVGCLHGAFTPPNVLGSGIERLSSGYRKRNLDTNTTIQPSTYNLSCLQDVEYLLKWPNNICFNFRPTLQEEPHVSHFLDDQIGVEPNTTRKKNDMTPNDILISWIGVFSTCHHRGFLWHQTGTGTETHSQTLCEEGVSLN